MSTNTLVAYIYDYFIFTSSPGMSNAVCPSTPSYITLAGDGTTLKTISIGTGGSCDLCRLGCFIHFATVDHV